AVCWAWRRRTASGESVGALMFKGFPSLRSGKRHYWPHGDRESVNVSIFGPILPFDLLRLARRGRAFSLRAWYAGCLLIALFLSYAHTGLFDQEQIRVNELAGFAGEFFGAFAVLQYLMVMVLAPACVAGCFAEERQSRALEILLTTPLSNREIILGKL